MKKYYEYPMSPLSEGFLQGLSGGIFLALTLLLGAILGQISSEGMRSVMSDEFSIVLIGIGIFLCIFVTIYDVLILFLLCILIISIILYIKVMNIKIDLLFLILFIMTLLCC